MAWRLARSLEVLRDEIRQLSPDATVWTIGDAAHRATASDHNPNPAGVVCAVDIVDDARLDLGAITEHIRTRRHRALKYVIYNRRIASASSSPPWSWRAYNGSNPHTGHAHVSVGVGPDGRSTGPYDDTSPWGLVEQEDDMIGLKLGDSGLAVRTLQAMLSGAGFAVEGGADGDYGPNTAKALLACRKSEGSGATNGNTVDHWAYQQLHRAVARRRAEAVGSAVTKEWKAALEATLAKLPNMPSSITIDLPDFITVPVEPADEA